LSSPPIDPSPIKKTFNQSPIKKSHVLLQ
jgi:hypothetical protein